ncbi:hypothetical protein ABPG75_013087 [Micractinium tetrahymenae]
MNDSCCPQEALDFQAEAEACAAAACDPTLEACCQRDLEQAAVVARLKAQLSLHDPSKERLRAAARVLGAAPPLQAAAELGSDLDSGSEDDELIGRLRDARLQELQTAARRQAELQAAGHGTLRDVPESRLLREAERCAGPLVCHLALTGSPLDDEVDEHLVSLAHRFLGTRFVRTAISLASSLHLRLHTPPGPGLLCFRDGSLVGAAGLDRFGAPDCIQEEAVDKWLRQLRVLAAAPGSSSSVAAAAAAARPGGTALGQGSSGGSDEEEEEEEEEEQDDWQQPCEVCGRRYPHQHIRSVYAGGPRGSDSEAESD